MTTGAGYVARVEFEEGRAGTSAERRPLLFVDGDLEASGQPRRARVAGHLRAGRHDDRHPPAAEEPRRRARSSSGWRGRHRGVHRVPGGPAAVRHALHLPEGLRAALARGWGVEVGLTIDVLLSGMRVLEVPCGTTGSAAPTGAAISTGPGSTATSPSPSPTVACGVSRAEGGTATRPRAPRGRRAASLLRRVLLTVSFGILLAIGLMGPSAAKPHWARAGGPRASCLSRRPRR